MEKLTPAEFAKAKREKLLDYKIYSENFYEATETIREVREQLQQPAAVLDKVPLSAFLSATRGLAWEATNHLATAYSGGHAILDLRSLFPTVLECWDAYAKYSEAYNNSEQGRDSFVAHMPLLGPGYVDANRLVCFGILLGWTNLIERLVPLIDYNNPSRDGLLERLIAPYVTDRGQAPDECTRHLPYFKTLKIFKAEPEQRSRMMAEYLDEWYHASRREPYYDSHQKGTSFLGYWSWEAAAITIVLDIDDAEYKDAQFYPRDLVDFARAARFDSVYAGGTATAMAPGELRTKAGDSCPKTGRWETLNIPVQVRVFQEGEIMSDSESPYGLTVWKYMAGE